MRFLANERLYRRTEECLEWLLQIPSESRSSTSDERERCHLYWHDSFSLKQAFAVKSFLATQDLDRTELWLWLDGESMATLATRRILFSARFCPTSRSGASIRRSRPLIRQWSTARSCTRG
jgi:NADPH-dependent ferric siderophore reductase